MTGFDPRWLALREPADAAARAAELVQRIRLGDQPVIRDLGAGTGSMGRWLAPRLSGPQHWILYDRDPALLDLARTSLPAESADGAPVTVETRRAELATLTAAELAGTALVTCSALLDVCTAAEVRGLVAACAGAGVPALFTLSVLGRVRLEPADPLDAVFEDAFNAHQRRTVEGRTMLGPDAAAFAGTEFRRYGWTVHLRPSPWRLGPGERELAAAWLRGWVGAAVEERPDLTDKAENYLGHRLETATFGDLFITVDHADFYTVSG